MSVNVASPTSLFAPSSHHANSRKLGTSGASGVDMNGGFGAVLAGLDDSTALVPDDVSVDDRRRKGSESEAGVSIALPDTHGNVDAKGISLPSTITDRFSDAQARESANRILPGGDAEQPQYAQGAPSRSDDAMVSVRPPTTPPTDGGASADLFKSGLSLVVSVEDFLLLPDDMPSVDRTLTAQFDATLTVGHEAAKPTRRSFSQESGAAAGRKTSNGVDSSKIRLIEDSLRTKQSSEFGTGQAQIASLQTTDGSVRSRLSQEFKLLSQQVGFMQETAKTLALVDIEQNSSRSGNSAKDSPPAEAGLKGDGAGSDFGGHDEFSSAETVGDGAAATFADTEKHADYFLPQELSNAKIKLGDLADGIVEVSISLQGSQAHVVFQTDETNTRNALQDSGSELKEMLRRDGIELSEVSVGTAGAGGGDGNSQSSGSENRRSRNQNLQPIAPGAPSSAALVRDSAGLDVFV